MVVVITQGNLRQWWLMGDLKESRNKLTFIWFDMTCIANKGNIDLRTLSWEGACSRNGKIMSMF